MFFCCCSALKSCLTLCKPMDCSTPSFPVLHYLPEFAQTLVHRVNDAIQPSYPLSPLSLSALSLSQHQGIFQWVSSSHLEHGIGASDWASVLPMNIQGWFPLGLTCLTLLSMGLSRVLNTKFQFFGTQPSVWSKSQICTWLLEKSCFLCSSDGKNSACKAGDPGLRLGWEGTLEKGMAADSSILDWRFHGWGGLGATVHGITKSWTWLSNWHAQKNMVVTIWLPWWLIW